MQATLAESVRCTGVGLHTGAPVSLEIAPAEPDTGIVFRRAGGGAEVPARYDAVTSTQLGTTLTGPGGESFATVEHLMSALSGLGLDNVRIEIDGPEVPILDGSAASFVHLLDAAGRAEQGVPRRFLKVLEPVEIVEGQKRARLEPADGFEIDFFIDFASPVIGPQHGRYTVTPERFRAEIAPARTFGFAHEVDQLRQMGLALGGSLDNAIVIEGDRMLNPGPLRFADEFVRHKALDAIGDLALAGLPILGRYVGERAGHAFNNQLLRRLFATRSAFAVVST